MSHSAPEMQTRAHSCGNSLPGDHPDLSVHAGAWIPAPSACCKSLLHRDLSGKVKAQSPGHRATTAIWPIWPHSVSAIVVDRRQAECSLVALKAPQSKQFWFSKLEANYQMTGFKQLTSGSIHTTDSKMADKTGNTCQAQSTHDTQKAQLSYITVG